MAVNVTKDNWESEISSGIILVDVWAPWCGPCKAVDPILIELEEEMQGTFKVVKLNVDNDVTLAQKLGVKAIPAFFIYKDGEQVDVWSGVTSKKHIRERLEAVVV